MPKHDDEYDVESTGNYHAAWWPRLGVVFLAVALLGTVALVSFGTSLAAVQKAPPNVISTVGTAFEFPVLAPNSDDGFAFSCVDTEAAINLFRSAKHGAATNVILKTLTAEFGLTLTFQGAVRNSTHACLMSMDTLRTNKQKLCIELSSKRCEQGSSLSQDLFLAGNDESAIFGAGHDSRHLMFDEDNRNFENGCKDYGGFGVICADKLPIIYFLSA
ncbi:expressed unknown protein [Seminavis robusta]|uniref:Uncharacterized protein n=1 Tax=Seminavis robusta TaxID=568900 RepID=A0A9N8H735_9STRA|nr:expressed unknown protein [Seminavis robusta]|eukprot:Sro129_g061730.1 n/a (217) ;mRNA; r:105537-106187